MRYLGQKHSWSCAPVALINALKWAGSRVTSKDFNHYAKLCGYEIGEGSEWSDVDTAIRDSLAESCELALIDNIKIDYLLKFIADENQAALITFAYSAKVCKEWGVEFASHICLVDNYKPKEKKVHVVNLTPEIFPTYWGAPRWLLAEYMRRRRKDPYGLMFPWAYLLRRR
jgi:hypothetical protein